MLKKLFAVIKLLETVANIVEEICLYDEVNQRHVEDASQGVVNYFVSENTKRKLLSQPSRHERKKKKNNNMFEFHYYYFYYWLCTTSTFDHLESFLYFLISFISPLVLLNIFLNIVLLLDDISVYADNSIHVIFVHVEVLQGEPEGFPKKVKKLIY